MRLDTKYQSHARTPMRWIALLLFPVLLLAGCRNEDAAEGAGATAVAGAMPVIEWAQPIERDGLPNLFKVNDQLYRGAQPDKKGYAELARMGIKTVVNLRAFHSDAEECERNGLRNIAVPMYAWDADVEKIVASLRVMRDPSCWPVFVHCQHGADRTGTVVAAYRVIEEGWSREEALREMTEGDFGFHTIWKDLPDVIRNMDVEGFRRKLNETPEG
jgi:protein tyrosine phosphatase (PTP) superfamily phosphohydrolase (DUF442 family)